MIEVDLGKEATLVETTKYLKILERYTHPPPLSSSSPLPPQDPHASALSGPRVAEPCNFVDKIKNFDKFADKIKI